MRTAVILGGAKCVFDDYEAFVSANLSHEVIAVNEIGTVWPGELAAWVSVHGAKMPTWMKMREANGLRPAQITYSGHSDWQDHEVVRRRVANWATVMFPEQKICGTSSLFAVKIALYHLDFERVILCGVPMEADQAHFNQLGEWDGAMPARAGWWQSMKYIKGKATSMSGWTRELLGAPQEILVTQD